jgi:hypothetical protein
VIFDDLSNPDRALNGQYPSGLIDWGTGAWYLSGPYGQFRTNSVGFNGAGLASASFTFLSPHRLVQLDAYNGGTTASTLSVSCDGAVTTQGTISPGQLGALQTGLSRNCTTVTIGSSNGWNTNFDNLVVDTAPPTPTSTATPTRTATPTNTAASTTPTGSSCPCTIWPSSAQPGGTTSGPSVELGVKLRADQDGFITAIRFYKASTETGTHVVNLWSRNGSLLGSATSSGETGSGWQQVNFDSPIAVSANTTYVASYHSNGRFGYDMNAFTSAGVDAPPLHALRSGADGPNGVYVYGTTSTFPTTSFNDANYFVDVVFTPAGAGATSGSTVTFDDLPNANRPLSGQYPSGVIDWGSLSWYLSGPYGQFSSNSVGFNGSGVTSASFTFVTPSRLMQVDAYNGGTTSSTVNLTCAGQPTVGVTLAPRQLATVKTGWTGACSTVTLSSSNGWDTNFDTFVVQ